MNRKTKVLIVENEFPLVLLMMNVLARVGCDADYAVNGQMAREKAFSKKFDLITLVIELPDCNGFDICSELKQRHISYKTPVLFVASSPCPEDLEEARKRGAVDYIAKPFDPTDLIYKVIFYAKAKPQLTSENGGKGEDS